MMNGLEEPTSEEEMRARARALREKTFPANKAWLTSFREACKIADDKKVEAQRVNAAQQEIKTKALAAPPPIPPSDATLKATGLYNLIASRLGGGIDQLRFGAGAFSAKARLVVLSILTRQHNVSDEEAALALGCPIEAVMQAHLLLDEWVNKNPWLKVVIAGKMVDAYLAEAKRLKLGEEFAPKTTIDHIKKAVAEVFHVTVADLDGTRRAANIIAARHAAFRICFDLTGYHNSRIGRRFGGKDHTTVIHALRKIRTRYPGLKFETTDPPLKCAQIMFELL